MKILVTTSHNIINILRCWNICFCDFLSLVIMPQINSATNEQKIIARPPQLSSIVLDWTHLQEVSIVRVTTPQYIDFQKSHSSCLFSTHWTKDFSYLIGANFSNPKTSCFTNFTMPLTAWNLAASFSRLATCTCSILPWNAWGRLVASPHNTMLYRRTVTKACWACVNLSQTPNTEMHSYT